MPSTSPRTQTALVMDVGGSHVTAAEVSVGEVSVGEGTADIRRVRDSSLDSRGRRAEILATLETVAAPLATPGAGWAVAMPGPFDYARGRGDFAGIGKFDSIAGLDLRGVLAERLRTDPSRVRFVNDAEAYGIGEWAFGDASRPDRMLCITLGTGVGSAFLDRGEVVTSGDDVPRDGHAHTITLAGAPLEKTVSTSAIRSSYRATSGTECSVEAICRAARSGDTRAQAALEEPMRALGTALAPWILRFGVSSMVVGGAMSKSWDLVEQPLREGLGAAAPGHLRASTLLERAPLVGAAAWSLRPVGA